MIREILGLIADMIGILCLWCQPDSLDLVWKIVLTVILAVIALALFYLTKDRPKAILKTYSWENNKPIILSLKKNSRYSSDMLVSIYLKEEDTPDAVCAVGYVLSDEETKLYVQVIHQIDEVAMSKITHSPRHYKRFYVLPYAKLSDVSAIGWN